jgi:uncharacterized protein (TIGR03083 family)
MAPVSTIAPLVPAPGERGLASTERAALAERIVSGWDEFLDLSADVDLDAPSRLPRWRGRDVLVHLGAWDDHTPLHGILASARAGGLGAHIDVDAHNDRLIAAHRAAPGPDIVAALRRARDSTAEFLRSAESDQLGLLPAQSVLGTLPVLTVLGAVTYELAIHARDLAPCGAPPPSTELLHSGLAALVDVTGALAARHRLDASIAASTPTGGWAFAAEHGDWTTRELEPDADVRHWPGLESQAATLLDASAGRIHVPPLLVRRELKTHNVPGLLKLVPIVDEVPNLPGGPVLRTAAHYVGGVGRVLGRLPRVGR